LSPRTCSRHRREGGFTLIEAVVALALVTVGLAAIGALVATNSRGALKLDQHAALANAARLVIATLPRAGAPMPDDLRGRQAGHRWQMRITPFLDGISPVPESQFVPQLVQLRIQAPGGAVVSFETVRLLSRSTVR
jgi:general secretion pathway protein I